MLPADLQVGVSRALGVPASTVSSYARQLRQAGLLTKQGRGIAAARMGAAECAALIVAVAGALGPSEAVDQFMRFERTRVGNPAGTGVLHALGLEDGSLSAVGALARFVASAGNGEMDRALVASRVHPGHAASAFEVTFGVTHPVRMQIRFSGYQGQAGREVLDYASPLPEGLMPRMLTARIVGGEALVSLGRALTT